MVCCRHGRFIQFNATMSIPVRHESVARSYFAERGARFVHNRVLPGTKYRPDFVFWRGRRAVIAECDENNHDRYNKSAEIHREHVLAENLADLGFDEVVIVRFNPCPPRRWSRRLNTQLQRVFDVITNALDGEDIVGPYIDVDTRRRLFTRITVQ